MTTDELADLAMMLRAHGIAKYYGPCGDSMVSLELTSAMPVVSYPNMEIALKSTVIGEANGGEPTEDEMLFRSSPFPMTADELNAKGGG